MQSNETIMITVVNPIKLLLHLPYFNVECYTSKSSFLRFVETSKILEFTKGECGVIYLRTLFYVI